MTESLFSACRLPSLPYSKHDSVADLDAPRVKKRPALEKPRPAVPARRCDAAKWCSLREHGHCDALHCQTAADYISNARPHAEATADSVQADVGEGKEQYGNRR